MDAQKVADRFRAALREVRSAVRLPATADLAATVRAVQALANRARRLEEALAAVRNELEPVQNHWLFVPPDGFRCLLCGEEVQRRCGAGGLPACGLCRSERCRRVREALAVARRVEGRDRRSDEVAGG